jgi:hypothetical protein
MRRDVGYTAGNAKLTGGGQASVAVAKKTVAKMAETFRATGP